MKKIFFAALTLFLGFTAKGQMSAQLLSEKIATRMKDSLSLSSTQKAQLYTVTLGVQHQLSLAMRQYRGSDSLASKLKLIEYTRDSLYRPILTDAQYNQYKSKKLMLVFKHS